MSTNTDSIAHAITGDQPDRPPFRGTLETALEIRRRIAYPASRTFSDKRSPVQFAAASSRAAPPAAALNHERTVGCRNSWTVRPTAHRRPSLAVELSLARCCAWELEKCGRRHRAATAGQVAAVANDPGCPASRRPTISRLRSSWGADRGRPVSPDFGSARHR